ncbi:MAG: sugar transferase [Emcibacteraceae bacterium]|jgi:lipopolysaccharide/colanic/teichoic acid biosynthesis glycosyltransferase|tara:strand:+ start:22 stop:681 length:660 start_codon:yes stop_codon:yes gene_type:complete
MKRLNYKNFWKRILDLLLVLLILTILSPFLIIIAILIRGKMGSPILFTQDRLGYKGKVFKIFKFRSMTNTQDENGDLMSDDYRLTAFGKFLRNWSIDELPQLWNIIIGDMSLIGPRPLVAEYKQKYSSKQMRRHEVRPGISGWSQVTGRNTVSWNKKFIRDVWYVDNCSLRLDLKILLYTIPLVLMRAGIAADNHVTMPSWLGNQNKKEPSALKENDNA